MSRVRIFFLLLLAVPSLKAADQYNQGDMRQRRAPKQFVLHIEPTGRAKEDADADTPCCSKCGAATTIVAVTAAGVALYQCPVHCLICTGGFCVSCALPELQNCLHNSCQNAATCCEVCCCPPRTGTLSCLSAGLLCCYYYCLPK